MKILLNNITSYKMELITKDMIDNYHYEGSDEFETPGVDPNCTYPHCGCPHFNC